MRWVVDYSWKTGDSMNGAIGGRSEVVKADTAEEAVRLVEGRDVVFVKTAKGFQATNVTVGQRSAGRVEIVAGLKPGSVVATRGAFLLKAELGKGEAEH